MYRPWLLSLLPAFALAQEVPPTPAEPPCSSAAYRQFDFWIGEWVVTQNGEVAGTNRVEPVHDGCAIEENWRSAVEGGVTGSSYNLYDQAAGRWHQSWVDSSGGLLLLDGAWDGTSMVLSGERPSPDGSGTTTHRITWTPAADGSIRQLWQSTTDGLTWRTLFDGLYRKDVTAE